MIAIIKDSFFVRMFLFLFQKYSVYKETSTFIAFLKKLKKYYRNSSTKRIFRSYLRQKNYYKYSVTYGIIDFISSVLSHFCRILHKIFARLLNGSVFFNKINSMDQVSAKLIFMYIAFFAAVSVLTYLVLCLLFYDFDKINITVSAVIAFFAVFCLCVGNMWQYIKNSLLYRMISYFFEE